MASIDTQAVQKAYDDVRDDGTDTNWAGFVYEDKSIVVSGTGVDHEELLESMRQNTDRMYAFVRVYTGDDMSRRAKFAFIHYLGDGVSAIARGKCSTDKGLMKKIIHSFATEFLFDGSSEIQTMDEIVENVRKAGGANYDG